jgi:hypothetical protein
VRSIESITREGSGPTAAPRPFVTVGRTVFYQAYGTPGGEHPSVPRAAIVTEVLEDGSSVGLAVLNPTGLFFNRDVRYSPDPKPGCWSWPPRV